MLPLAEVEQRVGRKKSWIYAEVKAGRFPPPDGGLWYASHIALYLKLKRREAEQVAGREWVEALRAA